MRLALHEESPSWTFGKRLMAGTHYWHAASMPSVVMTALLARFGNELFADNGKVFKQWLAKHKEYTVAGG